MYMPTYIHIHLQITYTHGHGHANTNTCNYICSQPPLSLALWEPKTVTNARPCWDPHGRHIVSLRHNWMCQQQPLEEHDQTRLGGSGMDCIVSVSWPGTTRTTNINQKANVFIWNVDTSGSCKGRRPSCSGKLFGRDGVLLRHGSTHRNAAPCFTWVVQTVSKKVLSMHTQNQAAAPHNISPKLRRQLQRIVPGAAHKVAPWDPL